MWIPLSNTEQKGKNKRPSVPKKKKNKYEKVKKIDTFITKRDIAGRKCGRGGKMPMRKKIITLNFLADYQNSEVHQNVSTS